MAATSVNYFSSFLPASSDLEGDEAETISLDGLVSVASDSRGVDNFSIAWYSG